MAGAIADATLARLVHAPRALPWKPSRSGVAATEPWSDALSACAAALETASWPDDPHGTVTDYWLGTLLVAAEDALAPSALERFQADHGAASARTVAPHVAILLRASPEALAERVASRAAAPEEAPNLDAEPGGIGSDLTAGLVRLQERLLERLRCGTRGGDRPLAVVVVEADDLGRAIDESIAAVEATG